jgi:hypothetical protein
MTDRARTGWESSFSEFREAQPKRIRERLVAFVRDPSPEQIRSWEESIPPLQAEVSKALIRDELARQYSAILEYESSAICVGRPATLPTGALPSGRSGDHDAPDRAHR